MNKFLYPKGGDAISTLNTAALLSSNGHRVDLWGMAHPLNPKYAYSDYFVSYVDLNNPGNLKRQAKTALNMLYSFEARSRFEALIKKIKPDIIHLNNFAHQISPSILHVCKEYKLPVVMTMHDYKLVCPVYTLLNNGKVCEKCARGRYLSCFKNKCAKNSKLKSLISAIEMYLHHKILRIYDLVDVFISPSVFLKNKIEDMGFKGKTAYLSNFVQIDEFWPQYSARNNSIIYFGRLSEEKGIGTLIDAVKDLDVCLKIVGEGPIKESLSSKVKSEKLNNVIFSGYKSGEELKEEIRESRFSVVPSEWYENNPRSIIESFALGKPVLGARIGGIPELVKDNETGLTFEPGNARDLKAKISYMINSPDKIGRMGVNARVFVEKELNPGKHYQKLMEIYDQAINHREKT